MFFRLLVESLRRGRRRKILALAAVTLGTLGATSLGALLLASEDAMNQTLAGFGANLEVRPKGQAETFPEDQLETLDEIFWRNNLTAIAPRLDLSARIAGSSPDLESKIVNVLGTWFDRELASWKTGLPKTRPNLPVDGRWPRDDSYEASLGRRLAREEGIKRGDRIGLRTERGREELTVVGIVGGGGPEEEMVLIPLSRAQTLAGRPGRITGAEIHALTVPEKEFEPRDPATMSPAEYDAWYCTAYPSAIAYQIDQALPDAESTVVRRVAGIHSDLILPLRSVFLGLAGGVLTCALLAVTATLTATVRRRRLEVALLSALGSSRRWIAGFHLTEAAFLGAMGGLIGGVAGLLLAQGLGNLLLDGIAVWKPVLIPFSVGTGSLVACLAALRPVLQLLSLSPARVLGGTIS
ncbi:MAG: ABC transporter permease [Thermoanaerobaculia bacterium]|nr:ABC transporter permease [Thermoanaerobaculia bacterium]